jgi:hypothetical protein
MKPKIYTEEPTVLNKLAADKLRTDGFIGMGSQQNSAEEKKETVKSQADYCVCCENMFNRNCLDLP